MADRHNGPGRTSPVELSTRLLVVGRIGAQRYAWPASSVERVLPMAAVTRVADLPFGVAGLIDVHGETLAVVDPRQQLGLPSQDAHPDQHLLVLTGAAQDGGRFLLWVDCIETIVTVDADAFEEVQASDGTGSGHLVTRVDGQLVQVLSPAAFDPGHLVLSARGPR